MKGIILAGGEGKRLEPLTKIVSKPLLPIYNKPLILYPLVTLKESGIYNICIIVSPKNKTSIKKFLGDGKIFGVRLSYIVQHTPKGMSDGILRAKKFIGRDNVAVVCADNIFENTFKNEVVNFRSGGLIFVKKIKDPSHFGVVSYDKKGLPINLIEKPKKFVSHDAITGFYLYDNRVINAIKTLKPSARGELEITDLHLWYLARGELKIQKVKGRWIDTGSFDALLEANLYSAEKARKNATPTLPQ